MAREYRLYKVAAAVASVLIAQMMAQSIAGAATPSLDILARDAGTLEQRADRMGAERVRTNAGKPSFLGRCKRGPDVARYES